MNTVDTAQIQIHASTATGNKSANNSRKRPRRLSNHPIAFNDAPIPIVVQQNLTLNSIDNQPFPVKLWYLVNCTSFDDVVRWSPDGTAIVFPNEDLFVFKVLKRQHEKIFKTESLKSFVRQLNLYGFRKVQSDRDGIENEPEDVCMFEHDHFVRGRPELLKNVSRRIHVKATKQQTMNGRSEFVPHFEVTQRPLTIQQPMQIPQPLKIPEALSIPETLQSCERQAKRRLTFSKEKENKNVGLKHRQTHIGFPSAIQRIRTAPVASFREGIPGTHLQESIGHVMPLYHPNLLYATGHMLAAPQISSNQLIASSQLLAGNHQVPSTLPMMFANDNVSKFQSLPSCSIAKGMLLTPSTSQNVATVAEETPSATVFLATPASKGAPASMVMSAASNVPGSFLNTPTSFQWAPMASIPNVETQSQPQHPNAALSPLSLLCANLFSPFHDNQGLHKATQTPPQSTQAALSLLADQASRKPKSPETKASDE